MGLLALSLDRVLPPSLLTNQSYTLWVLIWRPPESLEPRLDLEARTERALKEALSPL